MEERKLDSWSLRDTIVVLSYDISGEDCNVFLNGDEYIIDAIQIT